MRHRYQVPGEPLQFPTLQDLHRAMGDTAVMVCYPKKHDAPGGCGRDRDGDAAALRGDQVAVRRGRALPGGAARLVRGLIR